MSFNISQIINKFVPTKVTSSEIAVPTDLQYHDLTDENPLPTRQKHILAKELPSFTIPSEGFHDVNILAIEGNSLDINYRTSSPTQADHPLIVTFRPYSLDNPNQLLGVVKEFEFISNEFRTNFSTKSPLRVYAPRYRLRFENTSGIEVTVSRGEVVEHLGVF